MKSERRGPKKKEVAPGKGKATSKTSNKRADHTAQAKKIIEGRSTSTETQRQRALELLKVSAQTTYSLRRRGISHPAQRLKELIAAGHNITSARVTAVDSDGFTHVGVALYSLDPATPPRQAAFDLGGGQC